MSKTFQINIQGLVQGVGFRPFIFNLAKEFNLKGQVFNDDKGVVILCNTSTKEIQVFTDKIKERKPAISEILKLNWQEVSSQEFPDFQIIPSQKNQKLDLPLTPDWAICENCKIEIQDTKNRRFGYAFTTCVHCGPRYALTTHFPFDRNNTSLAEFQMCSECHTEYDNPEDRRFHSQTNSCKTCGIQLELLDNQRNVLESNQEKIISKTANLISQGKIVAIKNTSGYLLCVDARNSESIQKLREKKHRPKKPFALLYPNLELVEKHFELSHEEKKALISSVAPIVILKQKQAIPALAINEIAPNLNQLGVMLPSSALLFLLMQELKFPIIATSGNLHASPILAEKDEAHRNLNKVADVFLHHNLKIQFPQDDSVTRFAGKNQIIIRRSRGLAPNYLGMDLETEKPILAMGADLKSSFAFLPKKHLYISQYFGNLESYPVSERYQQSILKYIELFETQPKIILVDAHPGYQSHQLGQELANKWEIPMVKIPHHQAHFASVLGEHNLWDTEEKILGVVWDGMGLGEDGKIWGGEFFFYEHQQIKHYNHFEEYNWFSGDKMSRDTRLPLLSLTSGELEPEIQPFFSKLDWQVYQQLKSKNNLKTTSVGRLFDAVAALLEITLENTFEGEAAMSLETLASQYPKQDLIDFLENESYEQIPSQLLIQRIFEEKQKGTSTEKIAASFHFTLAKIILREAQKSQIKTVACSGGVFQNTVLVNFLEKMLLSEGIILKLNRKLSPNDENIAFGQLMSYLKLKI